MIRILFFRLFFITIKGLNLLKNERKNLLEMDYKNARKFFLKSESYFNAKLPDYVNFDETLKSAKKILTSKKGQPKDISDISDPTIYQERDNLNYTLVMNKGGDYSWRPLVLLHPILYVDLVNCITTEKNWGELKNRFTEFQKDERIKCYSIPVEASDDSKKTDTGETILNWWENYEQVSLAQNIKYQYCMFTDITDCYPSIYTHSITWAMYGKDTVKQDKKKCAKSLGDTIDKKISRMQHNQTNGIPQGSVLMDFIAEIVLGYVDLRLSEELQKLDNLEEYEVIRYRDDYRIFSNDRNDIERIMKILSEVLFDLNFKLNSNKTKLSDNIIIDSVKEDKLYWEEIKASIRVSGNILNGDKQIFYSINLQKHLLEIKKLADKFPNSGQLKKALSELYKERIINITSKPNDILPLISILVDIMVRNPGSLPHCVLIIGKLLQFEEKNTAREIVEMILKKYTSRPNTEYVIIWLQRLTSIFGEITYAIPLPALVSKIKDPIANQMFSTDWLNKDYQDLFYEGTIKDEEKYDKMSKEIHITEIDDFYDYPF